MANSKDFRAANQEVDKASVNGESDLWFCHVPLQWACRHMSALLFSALASILLRRNLSPIVGNTVLVTSPPDPEDLSTYSRPAIFFHWSIAALIGLTYLAIEVRGARGTDSRVIWTNIHYLAGCLVFSLSGFRVLWRLWHGAPPESFGASAFFAKLIHLMLYVFIFLQPLLGVLMVNTGGNAVQFPLLHVGIALVGPDAVAHSHIHMYHEWLGNAFYWVIGLHAVAAIGHHFILKDETLRRMLGFKKAS